MTDRPITFSAPMVRALLDGRKVQDRRILKPQPPEWVTRMTHEGLCGWIGSGDGHGTLMHVPYAVNDRLWVREVFAYGWPVEGNHQLPECNQEHAITYRAEGNQPFGGGRWHSPIHMPRWASRLTLVVSDVRVQRIQDISAADAIAEGCPFQNMADGDDPREWFRALWNSLHGPYAWQPDLSSAYLDLYDEVQRLRAFMRMIVDDRDRTFVLLAERAEEAEAERDRLRAALTIYAQSGNWRLGGCCDPNSPNFTGVAIAREALKGADHE